MKSPDHLRYVLRFESRFGFGRLAALDHRPSICHVPQALSEDNTCDVLVKVHLQYVY